MGGIVIKPQRFLIFTSRPLPHHKGGPLEGLRGAKTIQKSKILCVPRSLICPGRKVTERSPQTGTISGDTFQPMAF